MFRAAWETDVSVFAGKWRYSNTHAHNTVDQKSSMLTPRLVLNGVFRSRLTVLVLNGVI